MRKAYLFFLISTCMSVFCVSAPGYPLNFPLFKYLKERAQKLAPGILASKTQISKKQDLVKKQDQEMQIVAQFKVNFESQVKELLFFYGENAQDSKGNTLLHLSIKYDNPDLFEYLLSNYSNIEVLLKNNAGQTIYDCICPKKECSQDKEMIICSQEARGVFIGLYNCRPFFSPLERKNREDFLEKKRLVELKDRFFRCIHENNESAARQIIIDLEDINKALPVCITLREITRFDYPRNPFYKVLKNIDQNNLSLLHQAVMNNNYKAVTFLLMEGARYNIPNDQGETAMQLADRLGFSKIKDLFCNLHWQEKCKKHEAQKEVESLKCYKIGVQNAMNKTMEKIEKRDRWMNYMVGATFASSIGFVVTSFFKAFSSTNVAS